MSELKTLRVEDGVALQTLKRPEVMNAINYALRAQLMLSDTWKEKTRSFAAGERKA